MLGLKLTIMGTMPRAPLWMRKLGIEWIFRLYKEPKRMWKRYIIGNPLFVFRLKKWMNTGKLGFETSVASSVK